MKTNPIQLPVSSIIDSKELKPYWNARCDELQHELWLPTENSYTINSINHIMDSYVPNIPPSPLCVNYASTQPVQPVPSKINIIATKKIRIYPQNEDKYHQMIRVYRRSYNLAIEKYKNGTYKDSNGKSIDLRPEIRSVVKSECELSNSVFDVNVSNEAVRSAGNTFRAICSKNKTLKGSSSGFAQMQFKSRKGYVHTFALDRMPKGHCPCVKSLGKIHITESVPDEAIGKQVRVTYDHGRWYINVQQCREIQPEIQGEVQCVAIDPGVRTFGTCYSTKEVLVTGQNFAKNVLLPLAKEMRKLFSKRAKILNLLKNIDELPQWALDEMRFIEKKLQYLECKKQDKIRDLHHRFAWYLVQNYDVIFLPTFETTKMVRKSTGNTGKTRKINRTAVSSMLSLQHYKFKQLLRWYCKKYGKIVLDANESYTSKTRSWDGTIEENLGSSKTIKDDSIVMDRDINGARGIYLKCLTSSSST